MFTFYTQPQQRWLLKCHLVWNMELKETPLSINHWKGCVIVLVVVGVTYLVRLPCLTWARLPTRETQCERKCRGVQGIQTLHRLNTCKICLKYCFIMTPTRVRADQWHAKQISSGAWINLNSQSLCMLLPRELELPLYAKFYPVQMRNTKQAGCQAKLAKWLRLWVY